MTTEPSAFDDAVAPVLAAIAGRTVDEKLEADLAASFPPDGPVFTAIEQTCRAGVAAGWLCPEGEAGRRFGRVIEATPKSHNLSVDVVNVVSQAGPHHSHPKGEILMIMPVSAEAKFDGRGRGWMVYGPGTAHRPTVSDGEAIVLYVLPDGAIDWTDAG